MVHPINDNITEPQEPLPTYEQLVSQTLLMHQGLTHHAARIVELTKNIAILNDNLVKAIEKLQEQEVRLINMESFFLMKKYPDKVL